MSETEAEQTAVPLDDVDRDIIRELTTDGRMSITQVAENVHISRAHAYSRIARLTGEGVLTKFTALVDPIKAGPTVFRLRHPQGPAAFLAGTQGALAGDPRGSPHCAGGRRL
ncbi:hypothetical protein StoSoilB13_18920 [Arthrobacter sp. StoSoilB13]|nr:hypothetical protein StoSoilB13_18920 [Arthrobacter sp. StoSoilB13]